MTVNVVTGDAIEILKHMPDRSVHCAVTSPPFFGLRNYGVDGQIGSEALHDCHGWATARPCGECHVCTLVGVFAEVRRVLSDDGTCWINYGDSYCAGTGADRLPTTTAGGRVPTSWSTRSQPQRIRPIGYVKPKDLMMMPARVALALQADGWYLRQDIIWHKRNPMPESVRDRCTKAHEYLFLLSKRDRYYYDQEAIKEPVTGGANARRGMKTPEGWDTSPGRHGRQNRKPRKLVERGNGIKYNTSFEAHVGVGALVSTRNRRSVWPISTEAFPGAHFATFPTALIEPCILAGTSEKGHCSLCGERYRRVVKVVGRQVTAAMRRAGCDAEGSYNGTERKDYDQAKAQRPSETKRRILEAMSQVKAHEWRAGCDCDAPAVADVVLDPFGGAGTTGLVADRLGRDAILIELNPGYAHMARERIAADGRMFAEVR